MKPHNHHQQPDMTTEITGDQPLCLTQYPLYKYTSVCVNNHTVNFYHKHAASMFLSHLQLQLEESVCHSQVRTLRPAIQNRGGSSGRTAPSAEPGSDWWRDAKAPTEPEK